MRRIESSPKMRIKLFHIVLLLMATCSVAQQSSIEPEGGGWRNVYTGSFSGVRNLRIRLVLGSVRVEGGSSQGITYVIRNRSHEGSEERARRQFESYKINAYTRGDTAWIVGEWEGGHSHNFSSEVTVNVPRTMDLIKIETEGGEVVTTGISGRLEAETGGGSIHLDDIGGAISAETGGGSIDVGNAGGDLTVRTGGGTIHIGSVKGKVQAETGGGNLFLASGSEGASLETGGGSIHVDKCLGQVRASTGGGSIDLGTISGNVKMETGGGSLKISSATGLVTAETGGGSIELFGVPAAHVETGAGAITAKFVAAGEHANSILRTGAGDITVYIAPQVGLTIHASIEAASGHRIQSDFPEIKVSSEGGQWEPKLISADGNLNGGGPELKISTSMGNIFIRRGQ